MARRQRGADELISFPLAAKPQDGAEWRQSSSPHRGQGGDFRRGENTTRYLTDGKPERQGKEQAHGEDRGKCEGGTPSHIRKVYPCGYRREQNKVKTLENPLFIRVSGFSIG